jgi:hypothetical protein
MCPLVFVLNLRSLILPRINNSSYLVLVTMYTSLCDYKNVRENQWGNQEWTIQRNWQQEWTIQRNWQYSVYTRHRTKINKTKYTTQKAKNMSNTYTTKNISFISVKGDNLTVVPIINILLNTIQ